MLQHKHDRRVPRVEPDLPILPNYMNQPLVLVAIVLLMLSLLNGGVQIIDFNFVFFFLCPLFCILSQIYGFWVPLWYLLITLWCLLLTHVVHCGTFWFPLLYPFSTLLVSSDHPLVPSTYPFGTFSLPLCLLRNTPVSFILPTFFYLIVATLVPSDCPFLWYHLPIHCYLLITSLVPSEYPIGTFWLPPLLPSAYPFVTFLWLPQYLLINLWYLMPTHLVPSNYPFS